MEATAMVAKTSKLSISPKRLFLMMPTMQKAAA